MFCVWQSSVRGCRFYSMFFLFIIKVVERLPVPASFFPIYKLCYIGAETREEGGTRCQRALLPPGFWHQCNNVREKEGRGQGRLRRLVLYFKSKQSTSNTNLRSGTLNVPHAHNVSLRAFSHWSECTSSPPRFLSPSRSSDTLFYPVSPRSSLQSDTGVITLHLTHLLTAHLPSLSPIANPTEPRPPRHSLH